MKSSVVFLLLPASLVHCKVQCYDCLTPKNPVDWNSYCTEKNFCYGEYCTRGPNAKSNGILHGCSSTPPLDGDVSECKIIEDDDSHTNCYCKNNNFCNGSALSSPIAALLAVCVFFRI
ncbi:unnamed protein product [Cylicocyclus nassatus]|uniref:Uncharacterized protein n=1 Tax=Cylicocyclus nassatus TaxID=53992 RepID=A0AA36GQG7_CYLNA|nr:unnamed protein product [Cylicocyclus nassatus]